MVDDSITSAVMIRVVAASGSCKETDVSVSVSVRRVQILQKRVMVEWTSTRLHALSDRPLQFCRCLQYGHVRNNYRTEVDVSDGYLSGVGKGL